MLRKDRLETLRKGRGISQEEFAKELQISPRSYQRYENGEVSPNVGLALKIALSLSTTVAYLIGETEESKRVVLVAELSGQRKTNIETIRKAEIDPELIKKAVTFLAGLADK